MKTQREKAAEWSETWAGRTTATACPARLSAAIIE